MDDERHELSLNWVVVDGSLRTVSDFQSESHKARRAKEPRCPICYDIVTLKLGPIRTHHFAHKSIDNCSAHEPETIIHFNTKHHLRNGLINGGKLFIECFCAAEQHSSECKKSRKTLWLANWDSVQLEYSLGSYRLDVALLKGELVIGAIEIQVSHANTASKLAYFEECGIPCLTIQGDQRIYENKTAWTIDKPLPYLAVTPPQTLWVCGACKALEEQYSNLQSQIATRNSQIWGANLEPLEKFQHGGIHLDIYASGIVDFYYPDGTSERDLYRIYEEVYSDGTFHKVWLTTDSQRQLKVIPNPNSDWKKILYEVYKLDIKERINRIEGTFADKQEKWFRGFPIHQHRVIHGASEYSMRYKWNGLNWQKVQSENSISWSEIDNRAKENDATDIHMD